MTDTTVKETPAYVAFSTLKNTIDIFRQSTLPSHIDSSVLPRGMSGGNRSAVLLALEFLNLITPDGRPTESLQRLCKAATPDEQSATYKQVFEKKYPETLRRLLPNASKNSFEKAFEETFEVSGDTTKKGIRFMVSLSKESGISVSPFLGVKTRMKRSSVRRKSNATDGAGTPPDTTLGAQSHQGQKNMLGGWDISHLKQHPITVGGVVWTVGIPEIITDEDITRFTELVRMSFMKKK